MEIDKRGLRLRSEAPRYLVIEQRSRTERERT